MASSISEKLLADLKDALEEVNDEYEKVVKSATTIADALKGGFEKNAMRITLAKFNSSWLLETLEDLQSVIDDVKTEYNL